MPLPDGISLIQVVSTLKYVATVVIFDHLGNLVTSFRQDFGNHGELENAARWVPKGVVSWLWWDRRDRRGRLVGQGVYIWKATFRFENGKEETRYTRTGLLR